MAGTACVDWLYAASVGVLEQLVDVTLKGSLVLLVALVTVRLLPTTSAARRHLVLLLAISSFLVIPVLSATLPELAVLPARATGGEPAGRFAADPASARPGQAADQQISGQYPDPTAAAGRPQVSRLVRHPGVSTGVVAVWLAGIAWLALRTAVAVRHFRQVSTNAEPLQGAAWADLVKVLGRPGVVLKRSRDETMPMVWGLLRPYVLLPRAAVTWPLACRRAVVGHEVAHLVRRDPLTQAVARLVCTLFWFNPLLRTATRQLVAEQEKACDDLAVGSCENAPDYAAQVLRVVAGVSRRAGVGRLAPALIERSALEHRFRSILDPSVRRDRLSPRALVISVGLATLLTAPISMLTRQAGAGEQAIPLSPTADLKALDTGPLVRSRQWRDAPDQMGRSALHEAARRGHARALTGLLAQGFDPEATDDEGRTPLHLAAGSGRRETVAVLVAAGCNLSARDMEGRTPLHRAARSGYPSVVEQLLRAGGSADTTDLEGRTPLASAVVSGNTRVVNLLLAIPGEETGEALGQRTLG